MSSLSLRWIIVVAALIILPTFPLYGQEIRGTVSDAESGEALPGAIVRVLNVNGETLAYVMTNKEGRFSITVGGEVSTVRIALLGYKERTLSPPYEKDLEITLEQEPLIIKEAVVQERKVHAYGDTTAYNVKALTTRDDLVLGDMMKRIPGIEVTSSGHLKVDGKDLGHFYVNGKDVLEGNYNLATKKLSVDAVKKVEVIRNHQYIKMLREIMESDQAAVNIVLDEKARGKVNILGTASGGYQAGEPYIPNSESLTAFWLGEGFSSVLDAGFDASGKPEREATYFRLPIADNRYSIDSKLNLASAIAPLTDARSLFNKSFDSRSVNTLAPSENVKWGATISYSLDERNSSSNKTSTYHFADGPNKSLSYREERLESGDKLTGRISYADNASRHYISDVLFADIGRSSGTADVSGEDTRRQRGNRKNWDINNTLNMLFRTGTGRALGMKSYTQLSGFDERLEILTGPQRQGIKTSAIFEDLSFNSIQRSRGNITLSLQPVLKWTYLEREASLEGIPEEQVPGEREEQSRASYLTGGLSWRLSYRKGAFSADANGDIHYDMARYGSYRKGKLLSDESLGLKYETGRFVASMEGGISTSKPDIQDLGSVLILYDHDGLYRGQESLAFLPERYIRGEMIIREPVRGWYIRLNTSLNKTKSLLSGRDVLENYILSYYSGETVDSGSWISSAEITKGLYAINGKLSGRLSFFRSSSTFRQNGVSMGYVSRSLSPSLELSTSPFSFWNITGTAAFSFVGMATGGIDTGKTMNATVSLTNAFYVTERISAGVVTDLFHNSTVETTVLFPDAFIAWKSKGKLRLKLQANNLMNMKEYSVVSIGPLMETTYSYRIRPLSVILTVDYSF